ncbi:hypothetical protein [Amantichitinum ursilacus]|uniref:DUF4129 domain-containing protein n=1 Tax=Amantichitinum ursilacus TaxID=857265 RepID=A0A0N0XKA0_9NEIS|nr:hypothetical protein [Amantichitinum ursilacus]KPC53068.1 hypothetical protein WG78_11275 [Amantichitinum ursilacus]
MQIERLNLDLRPRSHWQAIDLGVTLLRAHARTVYAAWWCIWLPLAVILGCMPGLAADGWAFTALWLCKPLLERLPIYILSRAVFGDTPTLRQTLRAWPGQLRHGLISSLTIRRFYPGRVFLLPVWQLEGVRGRAMRQRYKDLSGQGAGSTAGWFGTLCAQFESILMFGLVMTVAAMWPAPIGGWLDLVRSGDGPRTWAQIAAYVAYVVAAGLIGPIYVASCFSLYLNRRSTLEGWDLELGLRQLQERLQDESAQRSQAARTVAARRTMGTPLLLAAALLLGSSMLPRPGMAAPAAVPASAAAGFDEDYRLTSARPPAANPEQARLRARVDATLDGPDFHRWKHETHWQWKDGPEEVTPPTAPPLRLNDRLVSLIKWLMVAVCVGALAYALLRLSGNLPDWRPHPRAKVRIAPPSHVAGMAIAPESFPADLPAEVRRLWHSGQQRAALALLYRGALAGLVQRYELALQDSDTEADCLTLAQTSLPLDARHSFARITAAWQAGAWGDRWPAAVDDLCTDWQRHFAAEARHAR